MRKKQIPINYNIHFEYECPNRCGSKHWLSLRETQEIGFKVVCDCGFVFKPKRIKDIKINFHKKPKPQITPQQFPAQTRSSSKSHIEQPTEFNLDIFLTSACESLMKFGFDEDEAIELVKLQYTRNPTRDVTALVKQTLLDTFGANKYEQFRT